MNRTQLNVIQNVLNQRNKQVKLNQTWRQLHDNHVIGEIKGQSIFFTDRDFVLLKKLYLSFSKQVPEVKAPKDADYMTNVHYFKDEKQTAKDVFADQLVFASVKVDLPLLQGDLNISHQGFVATVDIQQVRIECIKKLIIVENATMLIHLHDWYDKLPIEWQDSLFLYRGHGQNQNAVNRLFERLSSDANIAIYADFDPSGLCIVADYARKRVVSILVPKIWQSLKYDYPCNLPHKYANQIYQNINFEEKFSYHKILLELFLHIQKEQLAIMQENILNMDSLISIHLHKAIYETE